MSNLTDGELKLIIPSVSDDIKQTIGVDLGNNFTKIDDKIDTVDSNIKTNLDKINLVETDVKDSQDKISILNGKVKPEAMLNTTSQDLSGAVNEVKGDLDEHKEDYTTLKEELGMESKVDYLYHEGNEFLDKTGGWVEAHFTPGITFSVIKEENHISLLLDSTATSGEGALSSDIPIDLTNINTIYIDLEHGESSSQAFTSFNISKRNDKWHEDGMVATIQGVMARQIVELDVSSFIGEYYLRIHARLAPINRVLKIMVHDIYTDKDINKPSIIEVISTLVNDVENLKTITPIERSIKKKLYSFGVVSDIHLKDINASPDSTFSLEDYRKALTYYKENEADFVCIPGDLVANYSEAPRSNIDGEKEWVNELTLFKNYNQTYFTNKEVHFCAGNHDASPTGYGMGVGLDRVVASYENGTKKGEQVYQEITGRPLNYTFTKNDDVFIMFSMYYYDYVNFCRPQDITWLSAQLELYKDKRVFLFFHIPLPNTFHPSSTMDVYANTRALDFKNLIEGHTNVIWFSGHSHYDLRLESDYPNVNIFKGENLPIMVHCPSGSYLRTPKEGGGYYNVYEGSQGYMVDVYENEIVVNGIDFTKGTNGTAISIAHYII